MRLQVVLLTFCFSPIVASAQWTLQESHTTAGLRGIHSVDGKVAWASGTGGTVLRTVDGGAHWQACAVPDGDKDGATLDFRGVQAGDADNAVVMSSGKGKLSRLYKTVDGCATWQLLVTNQETEGFWDVLSGAPRLHFADPSSYSGTILGDPIGGRFELLAVFTGTFTVNGATRYVQRLEPLPLVEKNNLNTEEEATPRPGESSFAASNSAYASFPGGFGWAFGTGGSGDAPRVIASICRMNGDYGQCKSKVSAIPIAAGTTAGIFSLAGREEYFHCMDDGTYRKIVQRAWPPPGPRCETKLHIVAVGGDFMRPDQATSTAAYTVDLPEEFYTTNKHKWTSAETMPHGYRSAVDYDEKAKAWITVGPNGTDISADDGRNWRALSPGAGEPADADKNWNALSLPFVVGPKGRIGVLRADALKTGAK